MRKQRIIPFDFVLELLGDKITHTKPMFGCEALYVGHKIVLILRQKDNYKESNGIWIATSAEHHESLRQIFPNMRNLEIFGDGTTNWQVLHEKDYDFEQAAEKLCDLIIHDDVRVGRIPGAKYGSGRATGPARHIPQVKIKKKQIKKKSAKMKTKKQPIKKKKPASKKRGRK
jgi:hypothetical protein